MLVVLPIACAAPFRCARMGSDTSDPDPSNPSALIEVAAAMCCGFEGNSSSEAETAFDPM